MNRFFLNFGFKLNKHFPINVYSDLYNFSLKHSTPQEFVKVNVNPGFFTKLVYFRTSGS